MGVNNVVFQGKLGHDPEIKYTPQGTAVCKFSLANTTKFTDKQGQKRETTIWMKITAWAKLAEICAKYLVKGQECLITGKLTSSEWEKDGVKHRSVEIMANEMNFCGPAPANRQDPEEDIPF